MIAPAYSSLPDRFWAKVRPTGDCWVWVGAVADTGYGLASVGGRVQSVHRAAFMDAGNVIPDGHQVDHLCRVRQCVNPDHLEAVTGAENMRRAYAARGDECRHGHPLTGDNVYVTRAGSRRCRECKRISQAKWAPKRARRLVVAS